MAGRNPFEGIWNFIRGPRDEYETPPPPQARPDVRAPRQVDVTPQQRYSVEEGRITQERPGRLDTSGATEPREALSDREKALETQEYAEAIRRSLTEIRDKEAEVVENRYGRGIMSAFRGLNQWLHETDLGRSVKIAGKVVGGLSMAACAGFLSGTPGIAFSPALALMGKKMAISGAIEAFQYFGGARRNQETGRLEIGGRERLRRLDMEAGRARRAGLEQIAQDAATEFANGRLSAEEYRGLVVDTVRDIQQNEENILRNDREYEDIRKSNQRVRGLVSTGATLGLGLLTGVPFGIQDLDKDGVFHSVKGAWGGIRWMSGDVLTEGPLANIAKNFGFGELNGLVAGVGSNAANLAGTAEQFWQLSGGLGVAAAGMAAQTFREFGTLAQGSRARVRELLSENVRIEDGIIPRGSAQQEPMPAGASATPDEPRLARVVYGPRRAVGEQPETPLPEGEREGARGIYGRREALRPQEQAVTGAEPLPGRQPLGITEGSGESAASERTERYTPLTQAEIRNAANSSEMGKMILTRLGAENVPEKVTFKDFSDRFADMLRNADESTRDSMRKFVRDAYTAYEPIAKQPRDVKLESLRRINGLRELLPPVPPPGEAPPPPPQAPEAAESKMQKALRREDLLVQPNNLRGIVLERIGAGAFGSKNITATTFDTHLTEWLKSQTDTSISQTQKFIDRSRKHITSIEGLPDDDDRKVLQKNLTAARTILDALEQKISSRVAVAT